MPSRKLKKAKGRTLPGDDSASRPAPPAQAFRLFSLGHSNHPVDKVLDLLRRYSVETVVDVRSVPRSRYVPHFDAEPLRAALREAGIAYRYLGRALGGRPARSLMALTSTRSSTGIPSTKTSLQ